MQLPGKASRPTMYFIGVTTAQSSIMKVFPLWAETLGLKDATIKGIDIGIHERPEVYRRAVEFIRDDPLSMGALVTTHKIDLYNACRDMFAYLDPYARAFGELSSISKRNGGLDGYAKDPISSGLSMEAFIPLNFWSDHKGEVFIMGAGGSAISIGAYLMRPEKKGNYPARIVVSNRSRPRLDSIESIFAKLNPGIPAEYRLTPETGLNGAILEGVRPYSLIVNATGLGKDRPGSPLPEGCQFPKGSLVWELNYRGDLRFLHQAEEQREASGLTVEDGWIYFIHGWTQVIAEVFHTEIKGEAFAICEKIANSLRKG